MRVFCPSFPLSKEIFRRGGGSRQKTPIQFFDGFPFLLSTSLGLFPPRMASSPPTRKFLRFLFFFLFCPEIYFLSCFPPFNCFTPLDSIGSLFCDTIRRAVSHIGLSSRIGSSRWPFSVPCFFLTDRFAFLLYTCSLFFLDYLWFFFDIFSPPFSSTLLNAGRIWSSPPLTSPLFFRRAFALPFPIPAPFLLSFF